MKQNGDNCKLQIVGDDKEYFETAMKLAFALCPGGKAVGYAVSGSHGLILYWHREVSNNNIVPFPFPMQCDEASVMVWGWLKSVNYADFKYPHEICCLDHDGDNGTGYMIYNEEWGHVNGDSYAFIAIRPAFVWYGK